MAGFTRSLTTIGRELETINVSQGKNVLNRVILVGHLTSEFANYYNTRRAHMEREHLPPVREEPEEVATLTLEQIEVKSYVGGLVKSFERKAA